MVVICDLAGQILHANPATERVLGYRPQEMLGTNAWSYVHPEDLKATATARSAPLDDGIPFENRARAADGTYRWLEFVARRWPNQNPTHVVIRFRRAMHRDAPAEGGVAFGTTKLHVQLRYAASLARLSQLALGLPLVSDVLDAATSLGANALEAGRRLARAGRGRAAGAGGDGARQRAPGVGRPDRRLARRAGLDAPDPRRRTKLQREALGKDPLLAAAGAACALAIPVCGVDRVHGVLLLAGTTPRTFEPEDVHFAETVGNVLGTALDYRASQEALSRRERLTRAVFDHARDGLLIVDDDGRCVDANQAAHATLGAAPRALLGRRPADVVATSLDLASDGRTTVTAGEGTVRTGAGLRALELDRIPRIQPGLALVIVRDVTERRELLARLALADRLVAIRTLAAGVAHELDAPLSDVSANLQQLGAVLPAILSPSDPRADGLRDVVARSIDGTGRLRRIIDDLRTTMVRSRTARRGDGGGYRRRFFIPGRPASVRRCAARLPGGPTAPLPRTPFTPTAFAGSPSSSSLSARSRSRSSAARSNSIAAAASRICSSSSATILGSSSGWYSTPPSAAIGTVR